MGAGTETPMTDWLNGESSEHYHRHPAKKIAHAHAHTDDHHLPRKKFEKPETPTDSGHLAFLIRKSITQLEKEKKNVGS